jgi:hypothetical protein
MTELGRIYCDWPDYLHDDARLKVIVPIDDREAIFMFLVIGPKFKLEIVKLSIDPLPEKWPDSVVPFLETK